ncbi:hypothetical protein Pcinc_005525 [Petrolisthes cinctipes]|uniref:PiggyBac transposable element-derived protein domain-containing protein n=1 Tax=Petrolisthes cinctipes TaxID=88211 RepID=A0AAE1GCJ6_PETCI|nr:hypothetical protein Pcinc_007567 [Petrolisthes cinctipes]KAK3888369.1 hypothetical protein Pcinc_007569 [Petrolisthes cinctipes]KAK3888371.1 hypothetical protein Pcinc_007571 [Petrolisthes cinctipes]KAK3890539.1 hypothetical protein Pcinc_005513 [Petrolisthes cinctipes]KAK3890549.1 hypothetical protein Pcinc_005523 [Petrolisthes cinctipes]
MALITKHIPHGFASTGFYRKAAGPRTFVAPPVGEDNSDLEVEDEFLDDSDRDPDYVVEEDLIPTASGSATRIQPEEMPEEDEDEDDEEEDKAPPLPEFLQQPHEFFMRMLPIELLEDMVYQTNLYAHQKDVSTTFSIDIHDLMVFTGIVLYMGVMRGPSIDDYWALDTRMSQITEYMSSKRFRQIRALLHFNNNENAKSSTDRFYKVRPLFSGITKQFLQVKATPTQSIDEVMVGYKGTMAGNLRQYIANKPDKFGYKLFCRASIDGFIHDIVMY